jgi:hypothetical protein
MAEVSRTKASATGTFHGPVGEQFVQQPFPGTGAAQAIQGLALARFGEGDHLVTNEQLLIGRELFEVVEEFGCDSGHTGKLMRDRRPDKLGNPWGGSDWIDEPQIAQKTQIKPLRFYLSFIRHPRF